MTLAKPLRQRSGHRHESLALVRDGSAGARQGRDAGAELPSAYVSYSLVAVGDPHSDYAVQMRRVCQHKHAGFIEAVKQLPPATEQFFASHVINPDGCKVLALPEKRPIAGPLAQAAHFDRGSHPPVIP